MLSFQVSIGNILVVYRDGRRVGVLSDFEYAKEDDSLADPNESRTVSSVFLYLRRTNMNLPLGHNAILSYRGMVSNTHAPTPSS